MAKMLYLVLGDAKIGSIDSFRLERPALSNGERAQLLLDKIRTAKAERRYELLAVEAADFPGWKPLGDKMSDDEFVAFEP